MKNQAKMLTWVRGEYLHSNCLFSNLPTIASTSHFGQPHLVIDFSKVFMVLTIFYQQEEKRAIAHCKVNMPCSKAKDTWTYKKTKRGRSKQVQLTLCLLCSGKADRSNALLQCTTWTNVYNYPEKKAKKKAPKANLFDPRWLDLGHLHKSISHQGWGMDSFDDPCLYSKSRGLKSVSIEAHGLEVERCFPFKKGM